MDRRVSKQKLKTKIESLFPEMIDQSKHNEQSMSKKELMIYRYNNNSKSKVGSMITCPCCGQSIKKISYQKQFCSNNGSGNCKDVYWNTVDDNRNSYISNSYKR